MFCVVFWFLKKVANRYWIVGGSLLLCFSFSAVLATCFSYSPLWQLCNKRTSAPQVIFPNEHRHINQWEQCKYMCIWRKHILHINVNRKYLCANILTFKTMAVRNSGLSQDECDTVQVHCTSWVWASYNVNRTERMHSWIELIAIARTMPSTCAIFLFKYTCWPHTVIYSGLAIYTNCVKFDL